MKHVLLLILLIWVGILWNRTVYVNTERGLISRGYIPPDASKNIMIASSAVISTLKVQDSLLPRVKLNLSSKKEIYSWGTPVRYSIDVSDPKDGDSKYGEINGNEVLLEIEYLPYISEKELIKEIEDFESEKVHTGLMLMKKSTCFGCHADKTILAGPSFSKIADRNEKNPDGVKTLGRRILNGSIGLWGNFEMPSHPNFSVEESEQIADYILQQGGEESDWILPGLEGTFQIMAKPDNIEKGVYILKASYTSTSLMNGQHLVLLRIE